MVKLTPRRKQLLVAIGWRIHHYGVCKVADLLGDIGISHLALFDHLEPLKKMNFVEFEGKARNLSSNSEIILTSLGQRKFEEILNESNASLNEPLNEVLEKIVYRYMIPPRGRTKQKTLQDTTLEISPDAKITKKILAIMHKLFSKNITEPIITSLTMYSDIDQLLYELKKQKNPLFTKISRVWLNLEIRVGRLAGIAIPVALKGMLPYYKLLDVLRTSWAWPAIVSSNSIRRYKVEANSLGLVSIKGKGDVVISTKPSTSYILQWLADKTYSIFENSISPNPKLALLLYRESFNLPSENEIFEPGTSNRLEELLVTKEILGSDSYQELISRTFSILKQIRAIIPLEDNERLIPYGYLRIIESTEDLKQKFKLLMDRSKEGNIYSDILLAIQSKPGITLYELMKQFKGLPPKTLETILDDLQNQSLVVSAVLPGRTPSYYTFLQVPYIYSSKMNNITNEINTVIRYYTTFILSKIPNIFTESEELQWLYISIEKLLKEQEIESSYISSEFNQKFIIKFTQFATQLEPLIKIEETQEDMIFKISSKQKDYELAKHLLDIIAYEVLTGSEALGEYAQIWSRVYDLSKVKSNELLRELYEEIIEKSRIQKRV